MTGATVRVIPERLETILLARLAMSSRNPPTAVALAKLTRRFAPMRLTEPQWRELVEATLAQLQMRQIVGGDRRLLRKSELQTRVGPHTSKEWKQWAEGFLPTLALGIRMDDTKARRRLATADGWVSAIAGRELGLWLSGPPPTLKQLGDALIWREVGLPGVPQECPPTLRAHFLKRHITMKDGSPSQLVRQIASNAVQAPNVALVAVRDALVRQWLTGGGPSLIDAAREAAQEAHDGVFGDRKVFISSVWSTLRQRPTWSALALEDFKQRLVAAHRNKQLVLARADLVSAMDPALVAASETQTDGATFHFIVREPIR